MIAMEVMETHGASAPEAARAVYFCLAINVLSFLLHWSFFHR